MGTSRAEIWRKYLIGSEGNIYIKRKLYHNSISNYSYPVSEKISRLGFYIPSGVSITKEQIEAEAAQEEHEELLESEVDKKYQ